MRFTISIILIFVATSCTTREVQRNSARVTAANVTTVERQLAEYANTRTASDVLRHRTMNRLQASALSAEATNDFDVRAWTASGSSKAAFYSSIVDATTEHRERSAKDDAVLAANAALLKTTRSAVATRTDALDGTAKALSALAIEKGRDDFTFYLSFFKEVNKTIEAAKRKAKEDAAGAAEQTETDETGGNP